MPDRLARNVLATVIIVLVGGCRPSESMSPRDRLSAAIAAHGGREALSRLDDLRVSSRVVYHEEEMELDRTIHFRAPSTLAITLEQEGHILMGFGLASGACWQQHRMFVLPCGPEQRADYGRVAEVLRARALLALDVSTLEGAGTVRVDGIDAPAVRTGDLRLTFDPATRLLIRIDYPQGDERWVESFSAFEEHGGARIGTRRALTIDGVPDVSETWREISLGGADPAALVPPEPTTDGSTYEGNEPARTVAVADRATLEPPREGEDPVVSARRQLEVWLRGRNLRASPADGLVLLRTGGVLDRIALPLIADRDLADVRDGPFSIAAWPAAHFVGVFAHGSDPTTASDALARAVTARGYVAAPDATEEMVLMPGGEAQPEPRLFLLRVAVVPP